MVFWANLMLLHKAAGVSLHPSKSWRPPKLNLANNTNLLHGAKRVTHPRQLFPSMKRHVLYGINDNDHIPQLLLTEPNGSHSIQSAGQFPSANIQYP